ncbi:uncharacterized protein LOC105795838 isoform X3 [Gossypium raimondii]|uniref:uncharacterized protein LOC105795838 isoform X3 n=1 Tax=Gossypium raimondii TaxID=29730 RepID=UPI00227A0E9F|nr:uncharacterized protein LOC105795838 isoform X3 [Gossypium raimondii]
MSFRIGSRKIFSLLFSLPLCPSSLLFVGLTVISSHSREKKTQKVPFYSLKILEVLLLKLFVLNCDCGFLELGSLHWGLAATFQGELGVKFNIQESNFE